MKLKYQVSETINIERVSINGMILLKLKDEDYHIVNVTKNNVTFDDNSWKLQLNFQAIRRLQKGKFEISVLDNVTVLSLTYYVNFLPQIIGLIAILAFLLIGNIYDGTWVAVMLIFLFFLVMGFLQMAISKDAAKELLNSIIDEKMPE